MKKIIFIIFSVVVSFSSLSAQLKMEIGNNMLVETTGGVYITGASDVVETGTGYLKGVIESSSLSSATQFAGLTLSTGFTGTIKRTTGTAYAKGNGEGTNFKRYYELNNTSGSGISATCNIDFVASGANDESLGMNGPFFEYTYQSGWKGYGDGSTGSTVSASAVVIPSGSSDLVISEGTGVAAKIFLQGPYNASNNNMNTTLNADVPLTSPYSEDARTASAKPAAAVDWVLVQLRDQTTPSTIIGSRAAFLKADGTLIEDDGTAGIGIKAAPGDYYISIKHRNHLAVMTSAVQTGLTWGTSP